MRDNDARKLDQKSLEVLRLRAVSQVQAGVSPEQVATAFGLARGTVYGWLAKHREGGTAALLSRPVPGRPPRLSAPQVQRLAALITEKDPRQLGFEHALWTRASVAKLVEREFDARLSAATVGRLLHAMGLAPRPPAFHGGDHVPLAVARWRKEVYPVIRARAVVRGATVFLTGEMVIRPADPAPGAHLEPMHMTCAVAPKSASRFAVFAGPVTASSFISFCQRLLHDSPAAVDLIVDDRMAHRSKAVTDYVTSTSGHLELFLVPTSLGDSIAVTGAMAANAHDNLLLNSSNSGVIAEVDVIRRFRMRSGCYLMQ